MPEPSYCAFAHQARTPHLKILLTLNISCVTRIQTGKVTHEKDGGSLLLSGVLDGRHTLV